MIKESAITTWSEILSLFRSATWISHNNNQRNKKPNNAGLRNKRKKFKSPTRVDTAGVLRVIWAYTLRINSLATQGVLKDIQAFHLKDLKTN